VSGQPGDPDLPVEDALRKVWGSIWNFRAFEERSYRSIDHKAVGMGVLVNHAFLNESANGVALTDNPFDISGLEPAFYVNVQIGEASVVQPEASVTTDQFLYYFDMPGQPVTYIDHSNITVDGVDVLTLSQIHDLGVALDNIRGFFRPAYGPTADDPEAWYAMDVEFKFWAETGETPALWVKQARPNRREQ
jgi:pyruvate,water dikinase